MDIRETVLILVAPSLSSAGSLPAQSRLAPTRDPHNPGFVEATGVLAAATGYHYQFVFARNGGHVDRAVKQQTLPEALEWFWKGYRIDRPDRQ
jgi:hypothetical protein